MLKLQVVILIVAFISQLAAGTEEQNRDSHPIVGVWELAPELMGDDPYARKVKEEGIDIVYEFTAAGKANITFSAKGMSLTVTGTYKLVDETTMLLELDSKGERPQASQIAKFKVQGDILQLMNHKGQLAIFRRK